MKPTTVWKGGGGYAGDTWDKSCTAFGAMGEDDIVRDEFEDWLNRESGLMGYSLEWDGDVGSYTDRNVSARFHAWRCGRRDADENIEYLRTQLQIARGALADIAKSNDMTLELARRKAARIYAATALPFSEGECDPSEPPELAPIEPDIKDADGYLNYFSSDAVFAAMRTQDAAAIERAARWFEEDENNRWLTPEECAEALRTLPKPR